MTLGGGYVRVYYSILDDPKFEEIYENDHHLATWLRLLLVADQIWPAYPPIPSAIRGASLSSLVRVGLVDLLPKKCYRIHGLDAERGKRSHSARNAARVRWHSERNADALPSQYETHASPRPSPSPSPSPTRANGEIDPFDDAVQWLASRKAWIDSPKIQTELARLVDRKGAPAVIAAMAAVPGAEDAAQFVYGARNVLFPLSGTQTVSKEAREAQERADRRAALGLGQVR